MSELNLKSRRPQWPDEVGGGDHSNFIRGKAGPEEGKGHPQGLNKGKWCHFLCFGTCSVSGSEPAPYGCKLI